VKRYVLISAAITLFFSYASAQKKNSYVASNGIEFSVGDTVVLGVGSAPDVYFNSIYSGMALTIFASLADDVEYDFRLPEYFQGAPIVIKKIRQRDNGTLLLFDTEGWGGFVIDIEAAIAVCEVSYCRPHGFLTQEEFEKLVLLYRAALNNEISVERFEELRSEMLTLNNEPN